MAKVYYADLWGLREGKYKSLTEADLTITGWVELKPNSPSYLFIPQDESLRSEYEKDWKVTDIFRVNSVGVVTSRDKFVLDFDEHSLRKRIEEFRGTSSSDEEIRNKYVLDDNKGWNVANARAEIRKDNNYQKAFSEILYRPFDSRPLFYHEAVIERSRSEVMRHMLAGKNWGLISARSNKSPEMNHFFCSRFIMETKCGESTTQSCLFPLYLYTPEGELEIDGGQRRPNLSPEFIKTFSEKMSMKFIEDGKGDLAETFGPEDVFSYAYAVFHSPTYRTRYSEFLKMDFPRLPLTSDKQLFMSLAEKGAELVSLHLMESPALNHIIINYPVAGSNIVEKVTYAENNQRVYINKTQYFEGIAPEIWNFHIGGYQVCQKWLKDRKGRTLTYDDITHYQKVVVALKETLRLMADVDALIPTWPLQ
ncbi:MAG: hypothetical protein HY667_06870 [Chloroflexi bacterium]|nr:hypothetical protein [Chloroflexota bacterium]